MVYTIHPSGHLQEPGSGDIICIGHIAGRLARYGEEEALSRKLPEFDLEPVVAYWRTEAEEALQVADHPIDKQDYSYALFFGHLAVEKVLKALFARRVEQHAPPIHNLLRLAQAAEVEMDESQVDALVTITAFNIEARYPDVKRSFRNKCTPEYTARQMTLIQETYQWQRSLLPS